MKKTLKLKLPPEFLELCEHDGVEPELVIRGFIADLCELYSYVSHPRGDGYTTNGSDERVMAQAYYERVGYPYWHREPDEGT